MSEPPLHRAGSTFADRFPGCFGHLGAREPQRFPRDSLPETFREAAVLLPLWREGDRIRLLITERAPQLSSHSGQAAFPGGRIDSGETAEQAALREAHEEVGIHPDRVRVVGQLDECWSGAGHRVSPFVGWLDEAPELEANPEEVARLMVADLAELIAPEAVEISAYAFRNQRFVNRSFRGEWGQVVGMTGDLLGELVARLRGEPVDHFEVRFDELRRWRALTDQEPPRDGDWRPL